MTDTKVFAGTLLPCPFCGGDRARTIYIRDGRKVACICGACGKPEFHGPLDKPNADARAIAAWNTRIEEPAPAPTPDPRERKLQHVAYFDEGAFHWMSGIAPRDCELYAEPIINIPDPRDVLIAEQYLVWSNEHSAWWGRDRRGYTRIIANAGRYSRPDALSIAGTRDGGWYAGKGNPDEIAIPERDAIDQYANITREQDARAREHGSAGE